MNHIFAVSMVALCVVAPIAGAHAAAHDQLVVGMTAFSSSQHPYIDPVIVKSWTLGFTSRPVTYFTPDS